jgi:hypothetical protein
MKIITKQIENAFEKQGYCGDKEMKDIKIIMKLFNPMGAGTWYIYEKEDEDIYWAFVDLGNKYDAEIGTISMKELTSIRLKLGMKIERDMYFEPFSMTLEEIYNKVKG